MADGDLTVSGTESGAPINLQVGEDGGVFLPDGLSLSDASFSVNGDDLMISWPDGAQASVERFGAGDMPMLSDGSGAEMSGDMAFQLAQLDSPSDVSTDFSFDASGEAIVGTDGTAIGTVEEAEGGVWAVRVDGTRVELKVGDPVFQGDVLESGPDGSVGVILADDTTFSMGEDGQMVLDEMVYDPASQEGSVSVSVLEGVFTFVSGQVAKTDPDAMTIDTPVATIGIRGTQVGINLNEEQGMDVVLMEEADNFVGEVVLQNNGGVEILNTAFAASKISSFDAAPEAGFTMDAVSFLQTFGASLKSLPGINNANKYGVDQQNLDLMIEQAIEDAANAVQEETDDIEAEAEAADEEAEELAEAEEEAEDELEELQAEAAEEAEASAEEAANVLNDGEPNPDGEQDAQNEPEPEPEAPVVITNSNEPIPQLTLVKSPVKKKRTEPVLQGGSGDDTIFQDDGRDDEIMNNEPEPEPEPEPELSPEEENVVDLQDIVNVGGEGFDIVAYAGSFGTFSVDLDDDGNVLVTAADGSVDTLIDVESVIFGDGQSLAISAPPVLNATAAGDEDAAIPINIMAEFTGTLGVDTVETVTIEGIPAGAVLSYVGTDGETVELPVVDGVAVVAGNQTDGLSITPPANDSNDFTLAVTVDTVLGEVSDSSSFVVNVTPVADEPQLEITVGEAVEGQPIHLDITAAVTDSSENLSTISLAGEQVESVQIGNVPAGAQVFVSLGTDGGLLQMPVNGGVANIPISLMDSVVLSMPEDFSGEVDLTVSATSVEVDGSTATVTKSVSFDVLGVADDVVVAVGNAAGSEDNAIPLDVDLSGTDAGEVTSVTIGGVPQGAVLSIGTDEYTPDADGNVVIQGGNLEGLTLTPPADSDADFQLTVTATTPDVTTAPATIGVQVTAVADAPTVTVNPVTGNEDTAIVLDVSASLTDTDGSEALSEVTLSGIPDGSVVKVGGNTVIVGSDGSVSLTPDDLDNLTFTPPPDFSGDITLELSVTSSETTGQSATTTQSFTVSVDPVGDAVDLVVDTISGAEDTAIDIDLSAVTADGENLDSITITGIPAGATIHAGTGEISVIDGIATIGADQLANLTITPPADSDEEIPLTVTATSTQGGTSTPQTVTVNVSGVADALTLSVNDSSGTAGEAIDLDVSAALTDTDGSESLAVEIGGVPDGAVVKVGDLQLPVVNGVVSLTASQLSGVSIVPPLDFSGDLELTVTAMSSEDGTESSTSETLTVSVEGVVEDVPLNTEDLVTFDVDVLGNLDLSGLNDVVDGIGGLLGGSDDDDLTDLVDISDLADITISGVPAGAQLTAGTDLGDGVWALGPDDLVGLQIALDPDQLPDGDGDGDGESVDFTLDISATLLDGAVSVGGTVSFDYDDDELLIGSDGGDTLIADDANVDIFGLGGDDTILGVAGGNTIHGGSGDDTLAGSTGTDILYGDSGNDFLSGGTGVDELFGGLGDDELLGGAGADTLSGGAGDDILTGGLGGDTFIFDADSGSDIITDIMQQDTIVFEGEEFHAEDMIFRETEPGGDVEIAFADKDTTVKLEGVKMSDLDTNGDGDASEGYTVTQNGDSISVSIDSGES